MSSQNHTTILVYGGIGHVARKLDHILRWAEFFTAAELYSAV
jgi:hypothetical protein